jgi:hypothetical protein
MLLIQNQKQKCRSKLRADADELRADSSLIDKKKKKGFREATVVEPINGDGTAWDVAWDGSTACRTK